jgi:hypothetical protein
MITIKIGDLAKIRNDIDPEISGKVVRLVMPGPADVDSLSFDESASFSQDPMFTVWVQLSQENYLKLKEQRGPKFVFNTLPELSNTVISVKNRGVIL